MSGIHYDNCNAVLVIVDRGRGGGAVTMICYQVGLEYSPFQLIHLHFLIYAIGSK